MWILYVSFCTVLLFVTLYAVQVRSKHKYREKLMKLPAIELRDRRISSRKLSIISFVLGVVGPIPLSFIIANTDASSARQFVILLMITLVVSSVGNGFLFMNRETTIRALIEERNKYPESTEKSD